MSHNSMKFLENSKNKTILRIRMLVNTAPGHALYLLILRGVTKGSATKTQKFNNNS